MAIKKDRLDQLLKGLDPQTYRADLAPQAASVRGYQRMRINAILPPPTLPGVRETDYRTPENWLAGREALLVDASAASPD
jgi:hypothetical protein